jgi:hypothetical protein
MTELGQLLWKAIDKAEQDLLRVGDAESQSQADGTWTRREELGHLIDSAINNHVRFVKASLEGSFTGPTYDQDGWVALHAWNDVPWTELVSLWLHHNRALERVVQRLPESALTASCLIGDNEPVALDFLVRDYVVHMQHHVEHILEGLAPLEKTAAQ